MNAQKAKKEIKELTDLIKKYDDYYYIQDNPIISDHQYDQLRQQLGQLESLYPNYVLSYSPNRRVGSPDDKTTPFAKVLHQNPMLSITDVWNNSEVLEFDKRMKELLGNTELEYMVEPKYDGLSCNLLYEKGQLKQGSTRGDGFEGEDVTNNVRTIHTIPSQLADSNPPDLIEIRGEVIMFKEDFRRLNRHRETKGMSLFANPRNAAAGSLRQLDANVTSRRDLHFLGWGIGLYSKWKPATQDALLNQLIKWGFEVDQHRKVCKNIKETLSIYKEFLKIRDGLPFEIDGIVIKVNDFTDQEKLGNTSHAPRWSVAYKFVPKRTTTRIVNIISQVGRTGIVTPVAIFDPVALGGVIIKRATLHTYGLLQKKDIRIGDVVWIERRGDVIPEVVKPIIVLRTGKEMIVKAPKYCPSCGSILKKNGAYLICTNTSCPAQLLGRTLQLVSKSAFDIKGLGKKNVQLLIDHHLIHDAADIFFLKEKELINLPKWKNKKVQNILLEIKAKKKIYLSNFIYALSILGVGFHMAKLLAKKFKTIDRLMNADVDEIRKIPSCGDNIAQSMVSFFKNKNNIALISKIENAGVEIILDKNEEKG